MFFCKLPMTALEQLAHVPGSEAMYDFAKSQIKKSNTANARYNDLFVILTEIGFRIICTK